MNETKYITLETLILEAISEQIKKTTGEQSALWISAYNRWVNK